MRPGLVLLTAMLMLPLGAAASEGSIYRYVEKDGTIIYTNVPPPGSKRAKKLKGTFTQAQAPSAPVRGRASTPADLEPHIATAAKRYRIPAPLVRAIMHA